MKRSLELLAPAANKSIAIEAILHGADAVYIGATSHGARKNAGNSVEDIAEVAEFAHKYRSRVYVTVNTLIYEDELKYVEKLTWDLYRTGVDALIVQDMAMLRLNLPPIALHASTQCDIRTPEKARFLENAGFSQLVLARELSLAEISEIAEAVDIPIECFVHGALCVSYSGRCSASQVTMGRSANRGECAQICRWPYDLINSDGERILGNKHLLSLRDFNTLGMLDQMIEAGVTSFKIEGRLKEMDYVKNVVAAYSLELDKIIAKSNGSLCRSSVGNSAISFEPRLEKSFNRGFTHYFLNGRENRSMASVLTPKSMGEPIKDVNDLNNGDGVSFFNNEGEYVGLNVNRIENGRIISNKPFRLPHGVQLHRTFDREWKNLMQRKTADRKIAIDIEFDKEGVSASDERGVRVRIGYGDDMVMEHARNTFDLRKYFDKFGNTIYRVENFASNLPEDIFIPSSSLSSLRRDLLKLLDIVAESTYRYDKRREENRGFPYPSVHLDARDNVANSLARQFYNEHGVRDMQPAVEIEDHASEKNEVNPSSGNKKIGKARSLMTTRYCLRRELGCCKKHPRDMKMFNKLKEPLHIVSGPHSFRLEFDCNRCEMNVKDI